MRSELLYFEIEEFEDELKNYLEDHSVWYVTAMCPVTENGWTEGIYVTVKREE